MQINSGPPLSRIEARAQMVSLLVPRTFRNRYCWGFELDIVVESANTLINLEIDGLHHRDAKQRVTDARRDESLHRLGIRVVRVEPYNADGSERGDLQVALATALRDAGLSVAAWGAS